VTVQEDSASRIDQKGRKAISNSASPRLCLLLSIGGIEKIKMVRKWFL
jgi:hypothetical protein